MCGSMCTLFWMHKEVRSAGSLGAGVQAILSCLIWVLGFELRSSERSVQAALNLWTISPATHTVKFSNAGYRERPCLENKANRKFQMQQNPQIYYVP